MLYESLVVSLPLCISLSLCIVSAGDRLECGLRQQHLRQHQHYHGARHPLDHDPIIFDSASALHDNFDEAPSLLGDSCIFHRGVSDIGDNYDDEADDHSWRSPLERLSPLPSLSMQSSFSSEGDLFSTPATIISPGPQHAHHVDITAHQRQQQQLHQQQFRHQTTELLQRTRSTGTTIVALLANNSTVLILAADTRSTDGTIVADKKCKKLHALSNNIWCAGAGTSADVEALVRRVKFTFWKSGMQSKLGGGGIGNFDSSSSSSSSSSRRNANYYVKTYGDDDNGIALPSASVPTMLHHIRTQLGRAHGELGANLLVGGYDYNSHRALLAAVHPHGSMDVVNYSALGSGGLAAMGVLESKYPKVQCWGEGGERRGVTVEEGIQLAVDAVRAGIENDLGSGSQIDVCVIRREGAFCQRALVREQELTWTTSVHDGEIDGRQHDNKRRVSSGERNDRELKLQNDAGVNGFGNVPFAIRSKSIVCGGRPSDSGKKRSGWSMLD
jgi:20S proteasome subunit beta 2